MPNSILDSDLYWRFSQLLWKWKAQGKIKNLMVNPWPHTSHRYVAALFGYYGLSDMRDNWTADNSETLQRLCGPHGWVYYKLLLAQRGLDVTNEDS